MPLHLVRHPLVDTLLTELRDRHTPPARYRAACHRLTTILTLEATRELPLKPKPIETPLEPFTGSELAASIVIAPVLRAGLGMVEPVLSVLPEASVGHLGIERNHTTLELRCYYSKMPPLDERHILVVDPMLATGGTLLQALRELRAMGGKQITVLAIISAPQGVDAVLKEEPDLPIYTTALDRGLNDKNYIVPGLGDFGDRLMGTF
jgi:uracil phosphoribosyltransferase